MNPEDTGGAQSTGTELSEVEEEPPALSILCQVTHLSWEGAVAAPTGKLPRGSPRQVTSLTWQVCSWGHQTSVLQVCCHPDRTTPGEAAGNLQ